MIRTNSLFAVVLAGCMRIYPDPELPDVHASWQPDDCQPGITGDVSLVLVGIDTPSRTEVVVPCESGSYTYVDVARERFSIEGTLPALTSDQFASDARDVDLRNGWDAQVDLFLFRLNNVGVAWTIDGASCASLGEPFVVAYFSRADSDPFITGQSCEVMHLADSLSDAAYSVQLRAYDEHATPVAKSVTSQELEVTSDTLTDFGTLVLVPCDTSTCQ